MDYFTLMLLADLVVACVFIQYNRMLDAEARKAAAKRQTRDAQRQVFGVKQAFGLGK